MNDKPYSRKEIENFKDLFPDRGLFCPKCKTFIPQFADLNDEDKHRIKELILNGRNIMAIKELESITGCTTRWAKIWVNHSGKPTPEFPGPPCPYCGKPLKTSLAKMCFHCKMDWHDTDNPFNYNKKT